MDHIHPMIIAYITPSPSIYKPSQFVKPVTPSDFISGHSFARQRAFLHLSVLFSIFYFCSFNRLVRFLPFESQTNKPSFNHQPITPILHIPYEMCYKVVERYSVCKCLYFEHSIDPCSAYGQRGHGVQEKTVLVGYTCDKHSGRGIYAVSPGARCWSDSGYESQGLSGNESGSEGEEGDWEI